jgi:hypothetical protein
MSGDVAARGSGFGIQRQGEGEGEWTLSKAKTEMAGTILLNWIVLEHSIS